MDKHIINKGTVSLAAVRGVFLMAMAIFLIGLIYVGYRGDQRDDIGDQNAELVKVNQESINKNTENLKVVIRNQCVESQHSANAVNEVLDALIQGAIDSTVFTPAEKSARLARYRAVKVKVPVC